MLKSVQCDKFIENGVIRPPIIFKRGLNTVLGDEFASNSIGKSTFLMILDFVYGGDDYIRRSIDVQDNIGPHTINFTFEFEDELHYFSRATDHAMSINICNEHYESIKVISKDDYTKLLSIKFKLNLPGLTLRSAISRFFRIYGRETLDPKYPPQTAIREPMKTSIEGLLKLFNRYKEVKRQKEITEQAILEEDTFKKAQKYNYLPSVTTKIKYKENEKRILELEKDIEQLMKESIEGFVDIETLQTKSASELHHRLKIAKRQYINLVNELNFIEIDRIKRQSFQKDFELLQQFFPEANVKKLEDVENFHKKLDKVLKTEFKTKTTSLQEMIDLIAKQIAHLELKITNIGDITNVTHAVLNQYSEKQKELDLLIVANKTYITKETLKQSRSELTDQLNRLVLEIIAHTEKDINAVMKTLNELINEKRIAPHLTIKDAMRYSFTTPNDRGTGSQYKGLIIFDLATLIMTNLPLLVHDSVLLKQIEDHTLGEILKIYMETEKQIFISLDKQNSFSKNTQKILQETAVLHLYPNGGELFGRAWNQK